MNTAFLSLGSNVKPEENLPKAVRLLSDQVQITAISSIWHTQAIGSESPAFLNAAVKILAYFSAHDLKENILCKIEEELGRVRIQNKFAPRPIDLDILIFNDKVLDSSLFTLDHLIFPMSELTPELIDEEHNLRLQEIAQLHRFQTSAYCVGRFSDQLISSF